MSQDLNGIKPQEVITIFCNIKPGSEKDQWVEYPQLEQFFKKGYYIQDFKQTVLDSGRYMITFSFRRYSGT